MRPELTSYLLVAGAGFLITVATVPLFLWLSNRLGLLVEPDARRQHERPTSALGGGAMFLGFVAAFVVAWQSGRFDAVFDRSTEPWGVLACATVAYLVGALDDVIELSPPAKLAGTIVAAGLLAAGGVSIFWFRIPFLDLFPLSYDLAFVATVIWVLGMTSAVNFIDGLDGLAAGIMGIGATAFLLYGIRLGQPGVDLLSEGNVGPLVAAAVIGICTGFLPWNVFPARIFMGDGGALLLGALMASSTIAVGGRTPNPYSGQTFFFYAPLAIPLVILGVPMLDTAFAILRRARSGKGVATADKDHLHHRLVRLGHGHRRTVWILWAWTALLSAFVLYPTYNEGQGDAIVPLGVGAAALVLLTLFRPGFRFDSSIRRVADRRRERHRVALGVASAPPALAMVDSRPPADHVSAGPLAQEPEPGPATASAAVSEPDPEPVRPVGSTPVVVIVEAASKE